MPTVRGTVVSVNHHDGTFFIFNFHADKESLSALYAAEVNRQFTVRGHLPGLTQIKQEVSLELEGSWETHAKYGKQLVLSGWRPWAKTADQVKRFLQECVSGFGDSFWTSALVETFGLETFEVLTKEPEKVLAFEAPDPIMAPRLVDHSPLLRLLSDHLDAEAPVLPPPEALTPQSKAERALDGWRRLLSITDLLQLLQDQSLTGDQLTAIFDKYGVDAKEVVEKNPYCLMTLESFDFPKVDALGGRLGIGPESPLRAEGAVLWILREATREGHLYLPPQNIYPALLSKVLDNPKVQGFGSGLSDRVDAAIKSLADAEDLILVPDAKAYLPSYHSYEQDAANLLAGFLGPPELEGMDVASFLADYQRTRDITLSEEQRSAVTGLLHNKVLVLTGLPGTGKTMTLRAITDFLRQAGKSCLLVAPTGIAAKRMATVTAHTASTIHRALGYDGSGGWHRNHVNRLEVDAVIVDEASMIDQELFYRLLSALNSKTILVVVGDDAQLPSVGPGSVLRELLNCAVIGRVRLTQVFRQAELSPIVKYSHQIHNGRRIPASELTTGNEFRFFPVVSQDVGAGLIQAMVEKLKARDADFQVLSPMYRGSLGVDALNQRLQAVLNPPADGKRETILRGTLFREGDRVMVTSNDYDLSIYNGDVGKIQSIGALIGVRIHDVSGRDILIQLKPNRAAELLRLAYSVTVHKCQGQEFETVILALSKSHGRLLQRNLLYTAVTRAKKSVWIVGDESALHRAIDNDKVLQRHTTFGDAITQARLQEALKLSSAV